MLRLLGILSLGSLLFGGRRRALRRGILLGAILGFLANRDFDMKRVKKDVREKARTAEDTVRRAVKAAKQEARKARREERDRRIAEHLNTVHAEIEARKAERDRRTEERLNAIHAEVEARKARREQRTAEPAEEILTEPVSVADEAQVNRDLVEDLERDARTAAMAADVPTIDFPAEDEKYHSSAKYGYA